ncbi:MarR family winged helix-turn-helix transcriptional regulator [Mesorhizobium sp. IMUNJ 23232]|uniref:MarR family winged helix-turn-helix transcriptional regulator n=1 Tax=Mesorhizobium sp. IMUNJ 23232 TaxID=3376064 RepID=UPI0037BA3DF7
MNSPGEPEVKLCNCLALRQATRYVTQFYDQYLMPTGVRATQFSILAKLKRLGSATINVLAEEMVMDRTTLGRNIQPLQREGLIAVTQGRTDRRSKELQLTDAGAARLSAATAAWAEAQAQFETVFGDKRASDLRAMLRAVTASELGPAEAGTAI